MDPEVLKALREKLVARRNELTGEGDIELEPVLKEPGEKADDDAKPLTVMSQVIASNRNKTRSIELERVIAALQRMDDDPDEFGFCDGCGEDIPVKRLEIMPWARYCVACADARTPSRGARRRHLGDFIE